MSSPIAAGKMAPLGRQHGPNANIVCQVYIGHGCDPNDAGLAGQAFQAPLYIGGRRIHRPHEHMRHGCFQPNVSPGVLLAMDSQGNFGAQPA